MAGWRVFTRPSSSSGKPVTASTGRHRDAGGAERGRGAAGRDDLPAQLRQALGEGDDPALVADRDQRARHDEPDHEVDSTVSGSGTGRPAAAAASTTAGQQAVLDLEHARRELVGRIAGQHGHPAPGEDRAPVVLLVHQVDGGAALARAARQHGLVHVVAVHAAPAERGQQGRVHVHDAVAVAGDDGGRDQLQVAGQHEQVDPVMRQPGEPVRAIRRVGQHLGRDGVGARAREARPPPAGCSTPAPPARAPVPSGPAAAPRGCCRVPRPPRPRASSWPGKVNARRRAGKCAGSRLAEARTGSVDDRARGPA